VNTSTKYRDWARNGGKEIKFPYNFPISPEVVYREYWDGWDSLFEKRGKNDIMTYEEALAVMKEVAVKYNIQSLPRYNAWRDGEIVLKGLPKFPERLAQSPQISYKGKGWVDYDTYFFRKVKTPYCSFEDAKKWVQEKGITKREDFYKTPKPDHIISIPEKHYNEWKGWEDFLGKKLTRNKSYRPYSEMKAWVQENLVPLGINTFTKWFEYRRNEIENAPVLPDNFRTDPSKYEDFEGWSEMFGKGQYYKYKEFDNHQEVIELHNAGMTAVKIAEKFGVHKSLIHKILKANK
jgi:hypothetical protein